MQNRGLGGIHGGLGGNYGGGFGGLGGLWRSGRNSSEFGREGSEEENVVEDGNEREGANTWGGRNDFNNP